MRVRRRAAGPRGAPPGQAPVLCRDPRPRLPLPTAPRPRPSPRWTVVGIGAGEAIAAVVRESASGARRLPPAPPGGWTWHGQDRFSGTTARSCAAEEGASPRTVRQPVSISTLRSLNLKKEKKERKGKGKQSTENKIQSKPAPFALEQGQKSKRCRRWFHWGSNPGPSACKADVITTTLWNRKLTSTCMSPNTKASAQTRRTTVANYPAEGGRPCLNTGKPVTALLARPGRARAWNSPK